MGRACLFQAIDEDASVDRWFRSSQVHILNPIPYPPQYAKHATLQHAMFEETNLELLAALTGPSALALNMDTAFDEAGLLNRTRRDWWCRPSTWHQVLVSIG